MGELFHQLETDQEGAELVFHLRLAKALDEVYLKEALRLFCETNPKLKGPLGTGSAAVEQIWLKTNLTEDESYAYRIDIEKMAPLRIFWRSHMELCIIFHHSIGDGFSSLRFFSQWIEVAGQLQEGKSVKLQSFQPSLIPVSWSIKRFGHLIHFLIRRKLLAWFDPPKVLTQNIPRKGIKKFQLRVEIPSHEIQELENRMKSKFSKCSLNVWLIRTLVVSLKEYLETRSHLKSNSQRDRISVYVSMNLKPWIGERDYLHNSVSGYQIDTTKTNRQNDELLLQTIVSQKRSKTKPDVLLSQYLFLDLLLRLSQKWKFKLSGANEESWKYACTSNISNLIDIPMDIRTAGLIDALFCAPLTMVPIGLTFGVYRINGKLCLSMNIADYAMDQRQAYEFQKIFLKNLKGF